MGMNERTVLLICLLGSFAGIVSLFFLSFMTEPVRVDPGELGSDMIGSKVVMSGTASGVRTHPGGHIFFSLVKGNGSSDIVIWEDRAAQLELSGINLSNIRDGVGMEVTGSPELYKGNVQLVV
jgi:DNA/RNA endonuclease YhcR with UshA esterase domain